MINTSQVWGQSKAVSALQKKEIVEDNLHVMSVNSLWCFLLEGTSLFYSRELPGDDCLALWLPLCPPLQVIVTQVFGICSTPEHKTVCHHLPSPTVGIFPLLVIWGPEDCEPSLQILPSLHPLPISASLCARYGCGITLLVIFSN